MKLRLVCPLENGGCGATTQWQITVTDDYIHFDCQCGYRTTYKPFIETTHFLGPTRWLRDSGIEVDQSDWKQT